MGGFHSMIPARMNAFKSYNIFLHKEVGFASLGPRYFFVHRDKTSATLAATTVLGCIFSRSLPFWNLLESSSNGCGTACQPEGVLPVQMLTICQQIGSPSQRDLCSLFHFMKFCCPFWTIKTVPPAENHKVDNSTLWIFFSVFHGKNCARNKKS